MSLRSTGLFLLSFVFFLLLALLVSVFVPRQSSESELKLASIASLPKKSDQPNFVFVLSDDQDFRSLRSMPRLLDFFQNQGMIYRNHFLTTPVCCPSRESFLMGRYTHNHRVYSNQDEPWGKRWGLHGGAQAASSRFRSIATALKKSGYRNALMGKYLNGLEKNTLLPRGWDDLFLRIDRRWTPFYNYTMRTKEKNIFYGSEDDDYLGRVLLDRARSFMRRSVKEGKPFYLVYSTSAPHLGSGRKSEIQSPEPDPLDKGSYDRLWPGQRCITSPSFNEADVSDKPSWLRLPPLDAEAISKSEQRCRSMRESLVSLEKEFFALREELRGLDEERDTVFIFTTDNGHFLGDHRIPKGKFLPYEESVRFPLLIAGPGVPRGESNKLVGNIDLAPTVTGLASGSSMPSDGAHLWKSSDRKVILLEQFAGARLYRPYLALRTQRYLWVRYFTAEPPWRRQALLEEELYDLRSDPYQMENLLSKQKRLDNPAWERRLQALSRCFGQECQRLSMQPLPAPINQGRDGRAVARPDKLRLRIPSAAGPKNKGNHRKNRDL